jgi:hypothetical protein
MAVLKVGDWVLFDDGQKVGRIVQTSYGGREEFCQITNGEQGFSSIRLKIHTKPIDPAFNVLLTDVNK